jgi:hypothetical protein
MLVRAATGALSRVLSVTPAQLVILSAARSAAAMDVSAARAFASKAEGLRKRESKKQARQAKVVRKVQDPTAEVLAPHQTFATPLGASEKPYVQGSSRRVGVVALKCGMIPDWDVWGVRHALTVLKVSGALRLSVAPSHAWARSWRTFASCKSSAQSRTGTWRCSWALALARPRL